MLKFHSISYGRVQGKLVVTMALLDKTGSVTTVRGVQLTRKDLGVILKTIVAAFGITIA